MPTSRVTPRPRRMLDAAISTAYSIDIVLHSREGLSSAGSTTYRNRFSAGALEWSGGGASGFPSGALREPQRDPRFAQVAEIRVEREQRHVVRESHRRNQEVESLDVVPLPAKRRSEQARLLPQ